MNASSKNFERSDFDTHFSLGLDGGKFSLLGSHHLKHEKNMIQSSKPNSSFQHFFLSMSKNDWFLFFKSHKLGSLGLLSHSVSEPFHHADILTSPKVRSVGTAICALMVRSRWDQGFKGESLLSRMELFFFSKLNLRHAKKKKGSSKMSGGRYPYQSISMLIFGHFFLSDHFWSFPNCGGSFRSEICYPAGSKTTISDRSGITWMSRWKVRRKIARKWVK